MIGCHLAAAGGVVSSATKTCSQRPSSEISCLGPVAANVTQSSRTGVSMLRVSLVIGRYCTIVAMGGLPRNSVAAERSGQISRGRYVLSVGMMRSGS